MTTWRFLLAAAGLALTGGHAAPSPRPAQQPATTTLLRIYTINRGRLDDFVAAWRAGVVPLRERHQFRTPAAWIVRETNQIIWVMEYVGLGNWRAADSAYYASAGRRQLDPDPAQWIARAEQHLATPVVPGPSR